MNAARETPPRRTWLHRLIASLADPSVAAVCVLVLAMGFFMLPTGPWKKSDIAVAIRGFRNSTVHLHRFPVEIGRSPRGLVVIPDTERRGFGTTDVQWLLDGRIYRQRSLSSGLWAPTTERRFYPRPDQTSLSKAEWQALPGQLVPVLERLGYDDDDLDMLRRGIFEEELPLRSGYAYNTLSAALGIVTLASVVLSGARFWTDRRARRRADRGLCPRCAYDLKHQMLAGCPECGWQRAAS